MKRPRWKVWWAVMVPGREDIVRILENAGCEVIMGRVFTDYANRYTEEQLIDKIRDIDALMIFSREEFINRRVIEAGRKLKTIAKMGIGVEQIDLTAATELGILVTNTPIEENFLSVAEYTVGLILALGKRFKLADHNARLAKWRSVPNVMIKDKTVGIIGFGRIGSMVANLLHPFRVRLLAYDPYMNAEKAEAMQINLTQLDTLLKESDFVTIHAEQTEETRGLIGEAQLRMMKPTAYLVNTARGALVDEEALVRCLKEKVIAGAAMDVFEPEIPDQNTPLFDKDIYFNTLFSPHVAGYNSEAMHQMPIAQMENCLAALRGDIPQYVVNPEVMPKWRQRMNAV